jgi:hypothetical protein
MAGQDATTPLKQAKAQQERISHDHQEHQGKKGGHTGHNEICEKVQHQGK